MPDSLHALVKDALLFIAAEYGSGASLLSTPELVRFFEKPKPTAVKPVKELPKSVVPAPPKVEEESPKSIVLAPPEQTPSLPSSQLHEIIAAALPQFRLKEEVLPKQADAALLVYEEGAEGLQFAKNLAAAINKELCQTKLIDARGLEREKRWDLFLKPGAFRWILFSSSLLEKAPALMNYYKKNPVTGSCFLAEIPVFVFAPSSTYLKDPSQKSLLWKSLCQLLKR
jgi:hypothetical protein